MSKRWLLPAAGVLAAVAVVVTAALVLDRGGNAPPSSTATPAPSDFPEGFVIDYSDPELCPAAGSIDSCFVAGQPAGIPINDYFLQYLRVRAELGGQLSASPKSVRIYAVERAEWNESTLTGTNSTATVPGFRIVVEANGSLYVYQTAARAFQFAGTMQRPTPTPAP
ncbi:MAG: hypothetical protein FJ319_13400 [SAR202 cluster bacterium]|nr:hypothetical protein [SAR202 cluster bacterium]